MWLPAFFGMLGAGLSPPAEAWKLPFLPGGTVVVVNVFELKGKPRVCLGTYDVGRRRQHGWLLGRSDCVIDRVDLVRALRL